MPNASDFPNLPEKNVYVKLTIIIFLIKSLNNWEKQIFGRSKTFDNYYNVKHSFNLTSCISFYEKPIRKKHFSGIFDKQFKKILKKY